MRWLASQTFRRINASAYLKENYAITRRAKLVNINRFRRSENVTVRKSTHAPINILGFPHEKIPFISTSTLFISKSYFSVRRMTTGKNEAEVVSLNEGKGWKRN